MLQQLLAGAAASRLLHQLDVHIAAAWRLASHRRYATPRGTASHSRVSLDLLQALPFGVSQAEAEAAFWVHQRSNPLLAPASAFEKVKHTFLPYWLVQLTVRGAARSARVGHRRAVTRRDPVSRRMQVTWEMEWMVVHAAYERTATYPPDQEGMQVRRRFVAGDASDRPRDLVSLALGLGQLRPITSLGVLRHDTRVIPFTLRPADARARALEWVREQELAAASAWYKSACHADEVRDVDLSVEVMQQAAFPVYVPAYVFTRTLPPSALQHAAAAWLRSNGAPAAAAAVAAPWKLHTLVSGAAPGVVAGPKVYDPGRAAAVAGLLGPVVAAAMGLTAMVGVGTTMLLSAALAAVAAAAARHAPHVRHGLYAAPAAARTLLSTLSARWLPGIGGAGGSETDSEHPNRQQQRMEDPWVQAYGRLGRSSTATGSGWSHSSYTGRQQQKRASPEQDPEPPRSAADPQGFYALLGVSRDASQGDIQEAFRARALQQHPDRFSDPADKAAATGAFQRLSEAYGVLRSRTKRAAYDAGSRV